MNCVRLFLRSCDKTFKIILFLNVCQSQFSKMLSYEKSCADLILNKFYEYAFTAQCYTTFLVRNLSFLKEARVFVPSKPFHPSIMFVGKAGAYPRWSNLG